MHEETYKMLAAKADELRNSYLEPTNLKGGVRPNLVALKDLAEADLLLEEHERRTAVTELPARYARVHAMGHAEYLGPVTALGRGYRIEHHDVGEVGDGQVGIRRRWRDVHAVRSVEYLTDAEWAKECELMAADVKRRNERLKAAPHGCTGMTARWCPVHGRCTCGGDDPECETHDMDDADCPLHGAASTHAEKDEEDIPSDATAEAPAAETSERLAGDLWDMPAEPPDPEEVAAAMEDERLDGTVKEVG